MDKAKRLSIPEDIIRLILLQGSSFYMISRSWFRISKEPNVIKSIYINRLVEGLDCDIMYKLSKANFLKPELKYIILSDTYWRFQESYINGNFKSNLVNAFHTTKNHILEKIIECLSHPPEHLPHQDLSKYDYFIRSEFDEYPKCLPNYTFIKSSVYYSKDDMLILKKLNAFILRIVADDLVSGTDKAINFLSNINIEKLGNRCILEEHTMLSLIHVSSEIDSKSLLHTICNIYKKYYSVNANDPTKMTESVNNMVLLASRLYLKDKNYYFNEFLITLHEIFHNGMIYNLTINRQIADSMFFNINDAMYDIDRRRLRASILKDMKLRDEKLLILTKQWEKVNEYLDKFIMFICDFNDIDFYDAIIQYIAKSKVRELYELFKNFKQEFPECGESWRRNSITGPMSPVIQEYNPSDSYF